MVCTFAAPLPHSNVPICGGEGAVFNLVQVFYPTYSNTRRDLAAIREGSPTRNLPIQTGRPRDKDRRAQELSTSFPQLTVPQSRSPVRLSRLLHLSRRWRAS